MAASNLVGGEEKREGNDAFSLGAGSGTEPDDFALGSGPGGAGSDDVEKTAAVVPAREAAPGKGPAPASGTSPPGHQPSAQFQPANGGFWAWIQVIGAFSIFFNTWGILNTFGIFQTYYEEGTLFVESSSTIAWIGSVQAYFTITIGLFAGPIYDRGYLKQLLVVGSFMIVFGFMMLSICKTFWEALLAQGFCVGIGAGMLFVPTMAVIPQYFSTRLGMAIGLAASGSSMGGVIYPIVFYRLIDRIGFGWTVRTLAFIAFGTLLVPVLFLRMRVKPPKPRDLLDPTAFRDLPYISFVFSCFLGFIGLYCILFYISYYADAGRVTTSEMAFYIVPILNAGSVLGRTLPNALSDYTGPLNLIIPGSLVCGALSFALTGVHQLAPLIVIALLYGFFSGVFIALPPVIFVHLTQNKSLIGTRMGMGFAFLGFGALIGGPGAGGILGTDAADIHFVRVWVFAGVISTAAAAFMFILRMYLTKGKLVVKI